MLVSERHSRRSQWSERQQRAAAQFKKTVAAAYANLFGDFCNKICQVRKSRLARQPQLKYPEADIAVDTTACDEKCGMAGVNRRAPTMRAKQPMTRTPSLFEPARIFHRVSV